MSRFSKALGMSRFGSLPGGTNRRLFGMAFEPPRWRRDLTAVGRGLTPIQKRTCETEAHVRGKAIRTCTSATALAVVRLSVAPRPLGWLRRAGTGGRGRSDPPFSMPGVASRRVGCAFHPTLPRGSLRASNPVRYSFTNDVNCCVTVSYAGNASALPAIVSTGGSRILSAFTGRRRKISCSVRPWASVVSADRAGGAGLSG